MPIGDPPSCPLHGYPHPPVCSDVYPYVPSYPYVGAAELEELQRLRVADREQRRQLYLKDAALAKLHRQLGELKPKLKERTQLSRLGDLYRRAMVVVNAVGEAEDELHWARHNHTAQSFGCDPAKILAVLEAFSVWRRENASAHPA